MAQSPTSTRTKRAAPKAPKAQTPVSPPVAPREQANLTESVPSNVRLGRKSRMVGNRTVAPREITEEMEIYIERRLELPAGTTPVEIAADLCNRFGVPWAKEGEQRENRREAIAGFVAGLQLWIVEAYGDEIRDGMGRLAGFGDRIVVERGH